MKLPAVVWLAMVYYNATITFYGPQTSPTAIFTSLTVAILASFRHWHFYRQSGMCSGIIYPFYTHITVRACTYMFMLEFQLVIPYHNRHTHCPRLSPYVMSDLGMVYIQHGTVRDSHIWSLWHIKSCWSSRGVIGLHADAIWLASNAYMICLHVPDCHVRPWNVVYTARDSPGQPRAIVVVHQKRLKFERGHRATRQCDITYIQRIYDTYKYHGTHIGHFGRFSIFYSPGRVAAPYIRSMPI